MSGDIIHEVEIENLYKNQEEIVERLEKIREVSLKIFSWIEKQNDLNKEMLGTLKTMSELIMLIDGGCDDN